jgi:hypothetical protein
MRKIIFKTNLIKGIFTRYNEKKTKQLEDLNKIGPAKKK